jgi:hypothetical protein
MYMAEYHALSEEQRRIVDFLLAEQFPGVEALREQARLATTREIPGGYLVELCVDRSAPAAPTSPVVPVEAHYFSRDESQRLGIGVAPLIVVSLALDTQGYMQLLETEFAIPREMLSRLPDIWNSSAAYAYGICWTMNRTTDCSYAG